MDQNNAVCPMHVFRFRVDFEHDVLPGVEQTGNPSLCEGAFAECTGLEATMEPKVITEGGRNYGAAQRVGPVTFSTVILKRGITSTRHLWQWFELINVKGKYSYRHAARIHLLPQGDDTPSWSWRLSKAMPIKFKVPDLNAKGSDIGIEELHLAHEGITVE